MTQTQWRLYCLLLALSALSAAQTAPSGIPRGFAIERARQISGLTYQLSYKLEPHADSTSAHEEVHFRFRSTGPLWIDFREGTITKAALNGTAFDASTQNGHVLLPSASLRTGENALTFDFTAPVAPAGKALTRYEDKDDGSEYIYSLFVPMDADMAFPCFDQPDLKAKFTLDVTAPSDWTVISNSSGTTDEAAGARRTSFAETRPISTYLFAFAAGPFRNVHPAPGMPNVWVRKSQLSHAEPEVPQIQTVVADAMTFLAQYFAQPFPFPKYEMVLLPGFAYGGMEHAGATFLREESMLFRVAPTETDRFNRSVTLIHELAHQWFGDLVTMRWFDDLWLKEGFAQFMAYRTLAALAPDQNVWKRFYQSIKPAAYGIDVTRGTTGIYQDIPNLSDAKSAYGAIVYSKAPGLLRQLNFMLGDDQFRDGLRIYLAEHAYSNAEWNDLVKGLERSSHTDLSAWAQAWIHRRGMPEVRTKWTCESGRLSALTLSQRNVLGEGGTWPITTEILLGYSSTQPVLIRARFSTPDASIPEAVGKACPDYVFANNRDYAYGLFMLDDKSRTYASSHMGDVADLFQRTLLWGALWDAVRFAEMPPRQYLALARDRMPQETDEAQLQSLTGHTAVALHHYVSSDTRRELDESFERLAIAGMLHSPSQGLRIIWFRGLRSLADTPVGLGELQQLLDGKETVPGVQLRALDRWSMVTALLAHGDPAAQSAFEAEKQRDHSGEGLKYAYVAAAAKPGGSTKQWYFHDYLANPDRPEDWVEQSLPAFNVWNQSELTQPYLRPALEALPQVKRERKIFFVLAWLNAFIGGQQSASADAEVKDWLKTAIIDPDLRLKVLQILDDLDRTVKIRKAYP
ncbi:MAG TPA: M1 family aminopeptidase [Bryobacteraceae bacterium]|nr:M1 family aminopeptidase [Bryobacteraceae bacterium]